LVEQAITKKTKALVVVHYGGVSCDMKKAKDLCKKYNLVLIEDAAQAIGSKYKDLYLGSIGDMGAYSFHGTKNITCGEGGAILINKKKYLRKAQILYEKGTNRFEFSQGKVSKYNWKDIGSSFILSNFSASLLLGQLMREKDINQNRLNIWNQYYDFFSSDANLTSKYRFSSIPSYATKHNGHLFFIIFNSKKMTDSFLKKMRHEGYEVSKHYVPLHNSPFGKEVGRVSSSMQETVNAGNCSVRLPLWPGVEAKKIMLASSKIINKL
jgi:dTDP-4-amino-4,6-dideoxygalactose transaminase